MASLHTNHGTFGLVLVGADTDGHNGYVRGITTYNDGRFMATTGVTSRYYKTLGGAVRFMAKRGYDPFGQRLERGQ